MTPARFTSTCVSALLLTLCPLAFPQTSNPAASYIFPAGAQRGQTVQVTVGGLFLLQDPWLELTDPDLQVPGRLTTIHTTRLNGPQLTGQPSLEPDEYPQDHQGMMTVDASAPIGSRPWRVWTAQGATKSRVFVVGDLPEIVEEEMEGTPLPVPVSVPVTINGRINPRTDVDIWTFDARRGQTYAVELASRSILSSLDGRIALYANGVQVADDIGTQSSDPVICFKATHDGPHQIHVHDVGHAGGPSFVYRLTVRPGLRTTAVYPLGGQRGTTIRCEVGLTASTGPAGTHVDAVSLPDGARHGDITMTPLTVYDLKTERVRFQVSDLPEQLEQEPNDAPVTTMPVAEPVVLNGRIGTPGDIDLWPLQVQAQQPVELRLSASRLGSRLLPSMDVIDADGVPLQPDTSSSAASETPTADLTLSFVPEKDKVCWVRIRDRFASRGGPGFGYRLQVGAPEPGFHLQLQTDAVTAVRGSEATIPILVERQGGFSGPVQLEISGLPPETTPGETLIPADQSEFALKLATSESSPIGGHRLQVSGVSVTESASFRELATAPLAVSPQAVDSVLLSIAVATPFRFKNRGPYYAAVHAGTVYRHPFSVERNGFAGPISVRIADRQRRHLQGVRGYEDCVIPANTTDFEFPFYLPPDMSRDRLGRCLVMGVAEVTDEAGNRHQVAFTDGEESQAPINVKAPRLDIFCPRTSIYAPSESTMEIEFQVKRAEQLHLPVEVRLLVPPHIRGVHSNPVTLAADESQGSLQVRRDATAGPFNCPLIVQAMATENGDPVVAETHVEIVTD